MNNSSKPALADPFPALHEATIKHRRDHGCGAYVFDDGAGLAALSAQHRPRRILELGTALGYTACCLASGSPEAHVDTIERDLVHVELARRAIEQANLSQRITVHAGEFSAVLPGLTKASYDFAFFDGFAPSTAILNALEDLVVSGGVLVCANIGLATPAEAQQIAGAFGDTSQWRQITALENGATSAWVKV